jgi:hypothetical protein
MVAHVYILSTHEVEDRELEAGLGYIVRLRLFQNTQNKRSVKKIKISLFLSAKSTNLALSILLLCCA